MKFKFSKITKIIAAVALAVVSTLSVLASPAAHAEAYKFGVSPMNQKIVLNPGDSYTGTFMISNPGTSVSDIRYNVELENFYVDDEYTTVHEEYKGTGEILDWITINSPTTGIIAPNNTVKFYFTIDVPYDAPGGGQYASFTVTAGNPDEEEATEGQGTSAMIKETMAIAHLIFVEITGDIIRQGEITEANVPGFLLSGDITGSASIKNTGNTYGTATYTMQVFPLFSSEEVFTNEEDPEVKTILPDRTLYNETTWTGTPAIGIFNVVYTVEFEGVTTQVSKLVIKCPIWLLFIIAFVIVAIIIYFVVRAKNRKK